MRAFELSLFTEPPPPDAARPPRLRVQPKPGGRLELRITGRLPLDWSLRFAGSLAALRISLVSGYARRSAAGDWIGSFEADAPGPVTERLELSGLPDARRPGPSLQTSIIDFRVGISERLPGLLDLEVAAWDSVGLLAGTVENAAAVGLRPVELLLETQEGCAFHQLTLQAETGGPPTAPQQRSLVRLLAARLGAV